MGNTKNKNKNRKSMKKARKNKSKNVSSLDKLKSVAILKSSRRNNGKNRLSARDKLRDSGMTDMPPISTLNRALCIRAVRDDALQECVDDIVSLWGEYLED